jgi:hypothetical protein
LSGNVEELEATLAALPQDAVQELAKHLGSDACLAKMSAVAGYRLGIRAVRSAEGGTREEEKRNSLSRGRSRSKGAAAGEEVCGPVSSYLQQVACCMVDAGTAWAAWRLGLMWIH